jgi:hypothetical protein
MGENKEKVYPISTVFMLVIFAMALLLKMPKPSLEDAFKPIYQPLCRSNLPQC